jgi:prephenate dehydratase
MPGVPPARYAYLGPQGTFTEAALRQLPAAAKAEQIPCRSVGSALDAVRSGEADAAVVPIENSVDGVVPVTLDALFNGDPLMITREMHVAVEFALLAKPAMELEKIRRIATHPAAEGQCRGWIARHLPDAEVVLESSTALAAAMVSHGEGGYDAAIAAPIAGETYGLDALATHIADRPGAVTRFILVSRPGPSAPPTGADKTSLVVFIHENRPGALLELLEQFAVRGVDLTWIQSRPTGSALGKYCFAIDAEGHVAEARVAEALMGLRRTSDEVRFLGSYARADGVSTTITPGTADSDFKEAASWLSRLRQP